MNHKTLRMKEEQQEKMAGLPENAFRPLKPGEKYEPLMSPDRTYLLPLHLETSLNELVNGC